MTTRRRNQGPTWAIWWIGVVLTAAWPLVAFAHYANGKPGTLTGTGWAAEAIWLGILVVIGVSIAVASHRAQDSKLTDPLGAASKHNPDMTRGQGAERHPRRKDTPAPTA